MKDVSTNVLQNGLSERWVERHDGLTIRASQADMVNEAGVQTTRTNMVNHKTGFIW